MDQRQDSLNLRELILNTRAPIVLKNYDHQWNCFKDGLKSWCKHLDELCPDLLQFERIALDETCEPQWERKRTIKEMTALQFLDEHANDCSYWSGLNYKRKNEFPAECSKGIDFGCFGFPHATDDCTFWLSSKGANTPCHYDTYGCNIVVQVFGRKSWLLFPPNNSVLTPTRIPYEESSIYCKENLYAPNAWECGKLGNLKGQCYRCILEPNDVLIVPKHWWHYVEAIEISLSVNAWIPLNCDIDNQIEECITKQIMETFMQNSSDNIKSFVLNPNELTSFTNNEDLFDILEYLLEQKLCEKSQDKCAKGNVIRYQYQYLNESKVEVLKHSFTDLYEVPVMSDDEWRQYLKSQSFRLHLLTGKKDNKSRLRDIQEAMLNSLCSPTVVETIKKELFCRYSELKNNK